MQVISEADARQLYIDDGLDEVFSFEEYVQLLERVKMYVIREEKKDGQ